MCILEFKQVDSDVISYRYLHKQFSKKDATEGATVSPHPCGDLLTHEAAASGVG